MSVFRLLRPLTLVGACVFAAACAATDLTIPEEIPIESQTWAPSLQVTLSQFTKLTSGVHYLDSLEGTGAALTGTPTVSVFYSGYIPTGSRFDERSSLSGGTPICFPLSGLIEGWKIGLQGMKIGGKRRLLIPAAYGYGSLSSGGIPANSNLLFNVELVATGCTVV
ncbi:MAG: FKBP-type peptidyl-prolyl cis-trans isomerase [Gemmatimonadetes bacterium]|nr:FKBP-type peptidyl-prolyl cis-trans isomerase [Gemmatimonadota bacterium]MCC6770261.1 FKBP-type peptidyl-prolyl cis-trans isomerase [Gemmatimonadaceae bacterium]